MSTQEEFHQDLMQDLLAQAGAEGDFLQSLFTENMCETLVEQSVIDEYTQTDYRDSSRGYRIDAWSANDPKGVLYLIGSHFDESEDLSSLTKTDMEKSFSRMLRFFEACRDKNIAYELDESMPVTSLAWEIQEIEKRVKKVHLILVTNAALSQRIKEIPDSSTGHSVISFEVWDIGRLLRIEESGSGKDEIEIDFTKFDSKGIDCLPAYGSNESVKSYLLAIPGTILAELYEKYGERLLEQNVRTFLQFRGNVNKGIRNTILNEPQMFFSYNNGISATAEEVICNRENTKIISIKNLQIVNGGQTTAAVFNSLLLYPDSAEKVYVQVKLSVVEKNKVERIVPLISEYANTQNKVSVSDFFSNHEFHVRIEGFSRRSWAPTVRGSTIQTHWFYERTRGQYANRQSNLKPSEKRAFLAQNPRSQMFTKTDLAKFVLSFEELPHVVSKGAQKAFAGDSRNKGLVQFITELWKKETTKKLINIVWFEESISKAIIFRGLDKAIFRASWYNGYKAQIVTYTISRFMHMIRSQNREFDYSKIWAIQELPEELKEQLLEIAEDINDRLEDRPQGVTSNLGEWAKQEACWENVKKMPATLNPRISKYLIDRESKKKKDEAAAKGQGFQDHVDARLSVMERGTEHWLKLKDWNLVNKKLTGKEAGVLDFTINYPHKPPSDKQAKVIIAAEKRAIAEGFFVGD